MFLHKGREYYPLDLTQIVSPDKSIIYDRDSRNKCYLYVAVEKSKSKGEKE